MSGTSVPATLRLSHTYLQLCVLAVGHQTLGELKTRITGPPGTPLRPPTRLMRNATQGRPTWEQEPRRGGTALKDTAVERAAGPRRTSCDSSGGERNSAADHKSEPRSSSWLQSDRRAPPPSEGSALRRPTRDRHQHQRNQLVLGGPIFSHLICGRGEPARPTAATPTGAAGWRRCRRREHSGGAGIS